MRELLSLCGYEEPEIKKELPRVEKAFNKLGLTVTDIKTGKQRLRKYYDIELWGIRKIFRLCLREFVDSILAKEEGKNRILYGCMAPGYEIIGAALKSRSNDIYSVNHHWAYLLIAGCIFDKVNPVLEAAENMWLKAGVVGHCSNVKTMLGTLALDIFPKPDLMITSGSLCEAAPKTFDLLHEFYDVPVHFYESCQDRDIDEYETASIRAIEFQAKSLRKMLDKIQEVVGFEVTDDMLWEASDTRHMINIALQKMRTLIVNSDPLPLSSTHENLWTCLSSLTLNKNDCRDAAAAVNSVCENLQERINQGIGVVEKGSPRIMATCPVQHADPRMEHLLIEVGIATVAIDFNLAVPVPPLLRSPEIMLAMSLQTSPFNSLARRVPLIIEACRRLKVEGLFGRYHLGCRAVAGDAFILGEAVKKELDIPVLLLEWENFDPRYYNFEEFKRQLEVFRDMMISKRQASLS